MVDLGKRFLHVKSMCVLSLCEVTHKRQLDVWFRCLSAILHILIFYPAVPSITIIINIILVALGFELRALHLLGRASTAQATPPALFFSGYFGDRISHFCSAWPRLPSLQLWLPAVTGVTDMCHHTPSLVKMESCKLLTPATGAARNHVFLFDL
jgi:hypothetical protein